MIRFLNRCVAPRSRPRRAPSPLVLLRPRPRSRPSRKDEALERLLEKLAEPDRPDRPAAEKPEGGRGVEKPGKDGQARRIAIRDQAGRPGPGPGRADDRRAKPADAAKPGAGDVSPKDKELDSCSRSWARPRTSRPPTNAAGPSAVPGDNRRADPAGPRRRPGQAQGPAQGPRPQARTRSSTSASRSSPARSGRRSGPTRSEGGGPLGQVIKEMREVEQRLGKPDTGEETRKKQKQIVKNIETLIEQMKQSGGQSGAMAMRQVRSARPEARRPARPDPGANAGGAPNTKPAKPDGNARRWPAARTSGATSRPSSGRRWRTSSRKTRSRPRRT